MKILLQAICLFLLTPVLLYAQGTDTSGMSLEKLSPKFLTAISDKTDKYYDQVTSRTEKSLERLARYEAKIKTILEKTNPDLAQKLFGNNQLTFAAVLDKYRKGKATTDQYRSRYNGYRDKLTTTMSYLDKKRRFLDSSVLNALTKAQEKTARLNEKLRQTEAVEEFIKERKKQLIQAALQLAGKSPWLKKINKESYYYLETLKNYREIFSDPQKAEATALTLLNKIPAFQEFLRRNSMLASLFRLPDDPLAPASLTGLQTRAQVSGLIQRQLAAGGPNAMQQFQQNIQAAQTELQNLKNKILATGSGSSDAAMPDGFKPNNQKTKTFLQRLEYGANVQSQKATAFFPVTSDIGLSLGYKLNDKSIIGIGASYKMGWGTGWNNIKISHQGIGLRAYTDIRIKGSFWFSGGYEQNYRAAFSNFSVFNDLSAWQQSGLLGFSKSIPIKTKFFKKTKMQLLWDFLSYKQIPRTQPLVFRAGYTF